ncbi:hypothetical protein ACFRAO_07605 [Streptomyces sp. NPDC056656]|uniref:hypothetical protein n=1 Tax=Streptomyces sp. NPDC056656 TaxID=3345895 RepID=UPI0036BDB2EA
MYADDGGDPVGPAMAPLLGDLRATLSALCPRGPLVELRRPCLGPDMSAYGNLLRATDCPADATANRIRTIDAALELYPLVRAHAGGAQVIVAHAERPVPLDLMRPPGRSGERHRRGRPGLRLPHAPVRATRPTYDARGRVTHSGPHTIGPGAVRLDVPPSGRLTPRRSTNRSGRS